MAEKATTWTSSLMRPLRGLIRRSKGHSDGGHVGPENGHNHAMGAHGQNIGRDRGISKTAQLHY